MFQPGVVEQSATSGTGSFTMPGADAGGLPDASAVLTTGGTYGVGATVTTVSTALDLTVPASEGDVLRYTVQAVWNSENVNGRMNPATFTSTGIANYITGSVNGSLGGSFGLMGVFANIAGNGIYTVAETDVENGTVSVRLRGRADSSTRAIFASTANPITTTLTNLSRRNRWSPQGFLAAFGTDPFYYTAIGKNDPTEVEYGVGVMSTGGVMSRNPLAGAAAVDFSTGGVTVTNAFPAQVANARRSLIDPGQDVYDEWLFDTDSTGSPSGWATRNGSTSMTVDVANGWLTIQESSRNVQNWRMVETDLPAEDTWIMETEFAAVMHEADFHRAAVIFVIPGSTDEGVAILALGEDQAGGGRNTQLRSYSDLTGGTASGDINVSRTLQSIPTHWEVAKNSTDWSDIDVRCGFGGPMMEYDLGRDWGAFGTPTKVALGIVEDSGSPIIGGLHFLRFRSL